MRKGFCGFLCCGFHGKWVLRHNVDALYIYILIFSYMLCHATVSVLGSDLWLFYFVISWLLDDSQPPHLRPLAPGYLNDRWSQRPCAVWSSINSLPLSGRAHREKNGYSLTQAGLKNSLLTQPLEILLKVRPAAYIFPWACQTLSF